MTNAVNAAQAALTRVKIGSHTGAPDPRRRQSFNSCSTTRSVLFHRERQLLRAGPSPIERRQPGAPGVCGISVSFQYPFQFWLPFTSLNKQRIWISASALRADGEPVIRLISLSGVCPSLANSCGASDRAAQLVEFAVALPLLVLFVVGIFDFSNAFTLKQKLTNIARDAARTAAADPASDLNLPSRRSCFSHGRVSDGRRLFSREQYQRLRRQLAAARSIGLTWTYTATTNCPPGGLTITINRGYYFPAALAATPPPSTVPRRPRRADCGHRHLRQHSICIPVEIRPRGQHLLGHRLLCPQQITGYGRSDERKLKPHENAPNPQIAYASLTAKTSAA